MINISGLKSRPERGVQWVPRVPGHWQAQGNHSEIFTHSNDVPSIHLCFGVILREYDTRNYSACETDPNCKSCRAKTFGPRCAE